MDSSPTPPSRPWPSPARTRCSAMRAASPSASGARAPAGIDPALEFSSDRELEVGDEHVGCEAHTGMQAVVDDETSALLTAPAERRPRRSDGKAQDGRPGPRIESDRDRRTGPVLLGPVAAVALESK